MAATTITKHASTTIMHMTRDVLQKNNLVIFGLPGTLIDYGRRCSINAFMRVFNEIGIKSITERDIKRDLGIDINTHVRNLFAQPNISSEFRKLHMGELNNSQYNEIVENINSVMLATIDCYTTVIPGASKLIQYLHKQDIKVGVTTEYNMNITERIMNNIEMQGVHIDEYVASDEVRIGRPESWQAKILINKLGLNYDDINGIKIGDTVADIIEGQKLGFTTCNVTMSAGEMGFNKNRLSTLPKEFVNYRNWEIRRLWESYGCNMYVTDIKELEKLWCGTAHI